MKLIFVFLSCFGNQLTDGFITVTPESANHRAYLIANIGTPTFRLLSLGQNMTNMTLMSHLNVFASPQQETYNRRKLMTFNW